MTTHYKTLGVTPETDAATIRSAYRRFALEHHPDRSSDPRSAPLFLAATSAYETLSDPGRRADYDRMLLRIAENAAAERARPATAPKAATPKAPTPKTATPPGQEVFFDPPPPRAPEKRAVADEIARMKRAYGLGRLGEAERIAREVLERAPRAPEVHALLGDIAQNTGKPAEAVRRYAYAAQFDPKNPVYMRRYVELMSRATKTAPGRSEMRHELAGHPAGPLLGGLAAVASLGIAGWMREEPILPVIGFIDTWTLSLCLGMFASGLAAGAGLSAGGMLDRFHPAGEATNPAVALGSVAFMNFWLSCLVYGVMGAFQDAFSHGVTRLFACVGALTCFATLAGFSNPNLNPLQTAAWGGNVIYLGALCGWLVADSFRG